MSPNPQPPPPQSGMIPVKKKYLEALKGVVEAAEHALRHDRNEDHLISDALAALAESEKDT